MRPADVLAAECYGILRDLLRVTQQRQEGWQEEARRLLAVKERLKCAERINGASWPVIPQSVRAPSRRPPDLVEAELERLQRNLAKVRQLKSRGWEGEAASLAEREQQLQSELASSGAPPGAAAPSVAARGGADWRPLPDVETELLRVQRNIAHAREQQLAGWETAVAQLRKREQRLLDELDWRAAEGAGQQARPPGPAGAAERAHGLSSLWR